MIRSTVFVPSCCAAILALALLAGASSAQLDVNGPNAALTLQSQVPSAVDPIDHDVPVAVPGTFDLAVTSGANPNIGITLLASFTDPTGPVLPTPYGGSIDVGRPDPTSIVIDIVVVGNGIAPSAPQDFLFITDAGDPMSGRPPTFRMTTSASSAINGVRLAFQAVVLDPTVMPFPFDNTEVVDAEFVRGQRAQLNTGEDGVAQMSFLAPNVFNFHGVSYSDVFVVANGFITFGASTGLFNAGFDNDNVAWVNDQPSVAGIMCDWSPIGNSPTDGVLFDEVGTTVRIAWGDPITTTGPGIPHFGDGDANQFDITLQLDDMAGGNPAEGSFAMSTPVLDPATVVDFGDGLIGHTPGGLALSGGANDVSLRSNVNAGGPGVAQLEEHDFSGMNATNNGYDGFGSLRSYNNITTNWNGGGVSFTPIAPATAVTGDRGYISTPAGLPPADDVQGINLASLDIAGGQVVIVSGSFLGFDPAGSGAGTVVFDPAGQMGGPFAATVNGILDGTGQAGALAMINTAPSIRDIQGLVITTPPFTTQGMHAMQVSFASGFSKTVNVAVAPPGVTLTSYTLGDDDFVVHSLAVPVQYYGNTFNQVSICSNGFVDFVAGAVAINPSMQDFFDGFIQGGGAFQNYGVAAMWTDLNFSVGTNGSTYDITEDAVNQTVQVSFTNQEVWDTAGPAGTSVVTFGLPTTMNPSGGGNVRLDLTGLIADPLSTQDMVFGVTKGLSVLNGGPGVDTDLTTPTANGTGLFSQLTQGGGTGYQGVQLNESVGERFTVSTPLSFTGPIDFTELALPPSGGLWFIDG